jgi:hypothetical protein
MKTVQMLVKATGLNNVDVLHAGAKLVGNRLVGVEKVNGRTAYVKDPFYNQHRKRILGLATNPSALKALPTRNNLPSGSLQVVLKLPKKSIQVKLITIDDIDSFVRVKPLRFISGQTPVDELVFKTGVKTILNEEGKFQDWGGEKNDLFTTRLVMRGKRIATAFGFKGKGTRGILTPKKMGKNGDQIQRLFGSNASVFIIQYWGQIDQSVIEQMHALAVAKSALEGRSIHYGIVDGNDTQRLVAAYPEHFPDTL